MRSRTPGAFSQLSAFASAFLALPVTSRYASDLVFPLATIQREFLVPGILENRHRLYRYLPPRPARLAGRLLFSERDAALDCGGFCADLLTEGLAFVGIAGKLLLSKAGCKREIVNRKLLPQRKSSPLAISLLARTDRNGSTVLLQRLFAPYRSVAPVSPISVSVPRCVLAVPRAPCLPFTTAYPHVKVRRRCEVDERESRTARA